MADPMIHRDAAACKFQRERFGRAVQSRLGGGIVGLAAIAGERRHRGDADDPPPSSADHRKQQRLGHVEEAIEGNVDNPRPLLLLHPRHHGVVVNAGVVDDDSVRPRSVTSNATAIAEPPPPLMSEAISSASFRRLFACT